MSTALFTWTDNVNQSTTSGEFVNITGLTFSLPQATNDSNTAIVTLNVTQPYVEGGTDNGIRYRIIANDRELVTGTITNQPSQNGRSPITLVTMVSLTQSSQPVQAQWAAVRGATARLGGQASLSAILAQL